MVRVNVVVIPGRMMLACCVVEDVWLILSSGRKEMDVETDSVEVGDAVPIVPCGEVTAPVEIELEVESVPVLEVEAADSLNTGCEVVGSAIRRSDGFPFSAIAGARKDRQHLGEVIRHKAGWRGSQ